MRCIAVVCPALACCAFLASCGPTEVANAPPAMLEDCRREVAAITEIRREVPPSDQPPPGEVGPTDEVLDDARAGRQEARQAGIAAWPEEVLLYRCLASRGVMLTDEQARELAEWQGAPVDDESERE